MRSVLKLVASSDGPGKEGGSRGLLWSAVVSCGQKWSAMVGCGQECRQWSTMVRCGELKLAVAGCGQVG